MSGADDEVAHRFSHLWAAIRDSEQPSDTIDRIRDALDRKADSLTRQQPSFIEGSFAVDAVVYETETTQILQVTHRDLGTPFAIKTIPEGRGSDVLLIQRLRKEAEIGLALRNPCLQETSALLRLPDGRPGLLQPWVPASLASVLRTRQQLTADEILPLLRRISEAVAAMHAEGYVHGDITPANILLQSGEIKTARLGDFGITLRIGEGRADMGIKCAGSPEFSAPEQMAGVPAHPSHDVYGLGKLAERLSSASASDTADNLAKFVEACTKKHALTRPQSAEEAIHFL